MDPYRYFRQEAAELLEHLTRGVLDLEKGAAPADTVPPLLRHAHTLKGAARVVKQLEMAETAHTVEGLLAAHRETTGTLPRESVESLLACLDRMTGNLAALGSPSPPEGARPATTEPTDAVQRTLRAEVRELDAVLAGVAEVIAEHTQQLGGRRVQDARRLTHVLSMQLGAVAVGAEPDGAWLDRARRTCEDLEGALRGADRELDRSRERITRELSQLHTSIAELRTVPASSSFTFLERAVSDAARQLGKRVVMEARGGDLRVDAHVLEVVQNAFLHVVRNSVVHGIEEVEERRGRGKSELGRVIVAVERRKRRIRFSCEDDGRGVDLERLRRQRSAPGSAAESDEQLLERLLESGVSTALEVSGLAGRGVGLDVAREAAERLSGTIRLRNRPGQGVRVELEVPMEVGAFEGLLVESADRRALLPMDGVVAGLRLETASVVHAGTSRGIVYDGNTIPFVTLGQALEDPRPHRAEPRTAVVLRSQSGLLALGVERLLEVKRSVLRQLPALAVAAPVIAGAALDASGAPQLVLDADGLWEAAAASHANAPVKAERHVRVLVIDDSLTTRMLEQSILEASGYSVDLATSGEEGLEKALAGSYDLILVDVEMPGMDGFTFLTKASAEPRLKDIPAVLVTSRSAPEDLARGRAVGARGYIVKDQFDQGRFLGLIRRLTGGA